MTSGNDPATQVDAVGLPEDGVWRVGPATDPYAVTGSLTADELNSPKAGHRFDSPLCNYGVLYFATQLKGCFGETLARFRPDTKLVAAIGDDWRSNGFMNPGEIPRDWRIRRLAVRVGSQYNGLAFLDVESAKTRQVLQQELATFLAALGVPDLDVAAIRGGDRRITRLVSLWAWSRVDEAGQPVFAGIRYLSRLNTEWECWALFDRSPTIEIERLPILREMQELQEVARLWKLRVF